VVRTPGFHPGNRSSILLWATKHFNLNLKIKEKRIMANHKSALKRIRSNNAKRLRNKYVHKTTRNAVRVLRETTDKKEATALLPKVVAMLDKLAKRNIIHKKKASNLKSKLTKQVNGL
jgi:small subunit ribosomal protein S20